MSASEVQREYFTRKEDPFSYVDKEINVTIWDGATPFRYRLLARLLTFLAKCATREKETRTPDCVCLTITYGGVLRQ